MIVQRIEKHLIKESNPYYSLLEEFCFKSKNLYNSANYQIRQEFIKNNKYIDYYDMDKIMKNLVNEDYPNNYREMPTAQSAQQCLKLLNKNWKSYFKAIKDWKKHPEKYLGMPKIPKYKKKISKNILILTNFNCKLKEGYIKFPKVFNGFNLKTNVSNLQQIRILPKSNYFIIEVIYNKNIQELKEDNYRYVSIDIGVNNLVALTNNCSKTFQLINGRKLKSINQYYNKKIAYYKELAKRMNNLDNTRRIDCITKKRNNLISDLLHKASKKVIEYTLNCEANIIVIGKNDNWKQESSMDKINNQNFVQIPHAELINKIIYKAEECGIKVILTEESYTSGTSFLDNELPIKELYNKKRRVKRGMFISNKKKKINADINGSLQIMKKVFPNAFKSHGIEDCGFNPVKVEL